jgi:hypothetical protein
LSNAHKIYDRNVKEFQGINWEHYITRDLGELGFEGVSRLEQLYISSLENVKEYPAV